MLTPNNLNEETVITIQGDSEKDYPQILYNRKLVYDIIKIIETEFKDSFDKLELDFQDIKFRSNFLFILMAILFYILELFFFCFFLIRVTRKIYDSIFIVQNMMNLVPNNMIAESENVRKFMKRDSFNKLRYKDSD